VLVLVVAQTMHESNYHKLQAGLGYAGNISPQGLASLPLASYL